MTLEHRITFLLLFIIFSTNAQSHLTPKREFRGVWIATVYNIDWPDTTDYNKPEIQKQKFRKMLDFYDSLNFNAVITQVRAAGDVFYPTKYEPWARYLTKKEGKNPQYDPLKFMIEETHKRGLEFHAWFNPYRASMSLDTNSLASNHPFYTHRNWLIKYGKKYYFNPGLVEVQDYVTNMILEVVNKYDIDAVHFDDYFYPYKIKGKTFNDTLTFQKNGKDFKNIEDWRRANVDSLVKKVSDSIRKVKPHLKFGISPFGVWRNINKDKKGSATEALQTCYDDLYADALSWLKNDWLDYIAPQLYWSIGFDPASYSTLTEWWAKQKYKSKIYIGQGIYKIGKNADKNWHKPYQIINQITFNRFLDNISGSIFFSAKSLMENPLHLKENLKNTVYKYPAIIPKNTRLEYERPQKPSLKKIKKRGKNIEITWTYTQEQKQEIRYFLIYKFPKNQKVDLNNANHILQKIPYSKEKNEYKALDSNYKKYKNYRYYITAVNRYNLESE